MTFSHERPEIASRNTRGGDPPRVASPIIRSKQRLRSSPPISPPAPHSAALHIRTKHAPAWGLKKGLSLRLARAKARPHTT